MAFTCHAKPNPYHVVHELPVAGLLAPTCPPSRPPACLPADLQSFSAEAQRPKVEKIDDELDQWGRPKKRLANPIDVMPEDMQVRGGDMGCM